MPDARTRILALCRSGFEPKAVFAWTQPGETYRPDPLGQTVLAEFLKRSARRFEPIETVLDALFTDAVDVWVMRAALDYENGVPERLLRLDARGAVSPPYRIGVKGPTGRRVESAVDVWGRGLVSAGVRRQWLDIVAGPDADDYVLHPIVRYLRSRCAELLDPLLGRVLDAQVVGDVLVQCHFTDPTQAPPKSKGRPRGPEFMRHDPDWRKKAKALIAGRKRGRYWSVLLLEAGGISRHTAEIMIAEYEKEQRG